MAGIEKARCGQRAFDSFKLSLQACLLAQCSSLFGMLPRQIYIGTAEMTISSSLLVDRTQQIQLTDNAGRAQGEVFANQLSNLVFADFAGAEGFNQNGNRMCYADSVCQLDFAFIC